MCMYGYQSSKKTVKQFGFSNFDTDLEELQVSKNEFKKRFYNMKQKLLKNAFSWHQSPKYFYSMVIVFGTKNAILLSLLSLFIKVTVADCT